MLHSEINQPGGVAGLNGESRLQQVIDTEGVDTPTRALGDFLATGRANFRSMIDGQTIMRVSAAHRQANPPGEDNWTDSDGVVIGGYAPGRGSHVIMTCQDEGGMSLGACLSVWNSSAPYTVNRPGISPSTGAQLAHYPSVLDSVVFDNGTKNSSPKIVMGAQIADSDGTTHKVWFTRKSVFIYPVMLAEDKAKIKQFQTLVSNVSTPQYIDKKANMAFRA